MSRRSQSTPGQRVVAGILILTQFLWLPPSISGTYYWDSDADATNNALSGTGLGGIGTWDTSTVNWWNGVSVTDDSVWANLGGDTGIFTGTPGTVTLNSGIVANKLSFLSNYTLSGGNLTLSGAGAGIQVNLGQTAILNSPILGTDGLAKTGGGSLRLGNSNTYTGITTISNGSLVLNNVAALGADTSQVIVSGSATRGFGGGSLVLEGDYGTGVNFSRSLSIQGNGPLTDRSASLVSVRNNTLSGAVTTNSNLVATTITSVAGMLTISGPLNVTGTTGTTFTNLGIVNATGVGSYAITGAISGSGGINKAGVGTLIWAPSDASGFSGTIRIGTATSVRITSPTSLGTNAGTGTSGMLDHNIDNGFFEFRMDTATIGKNAYQRGVSPSMFVDHAIGSNTVNNTLTMASLAFEEGENFTFNGRNGSGLTFTTAPVQGGNNDSTFTNNLGGTLTFTGAFWSNTENTAARTFTMAGNGNTLISGALTASAAAFDHNLTKTGTGLLTLTSTAATLDGAVNVQGGAIAITDFRSITNNAATINLANATTTAGNLIIGTSAAANAAGLTTNKVINLFGTTGGGTIYANQALASPVIFNAASFTATGTGAKTLTLGGTNTQNNIINSIIPDSAGATVTSLAKNGVGTWVLAGANTFTGSTTITGGILKAQDTFSGGSRNVLPNAGALIFNVLAATQEAGGTFDYVGAASSASTETVGALTPTAGAGTVKTTAGTSGTAVLTLASLGTRGAGATLNYTPGANTTIAYTAGSLPVVTNNIIAAASGGAAYQTYNGVDWATLSGNNVAQYTGYTVNTFPASGTGGANTNYSQSANASTTGTASINTLKLIGGAGNPTITLGGLLTVTAKGVLFDNSSGAGTITGSQLGAANVETVIITNGSTPTNALTVNSLIGSGTGSLTKTGTGTLIVGGNNTYTGNTIINQGTVRLSGATATLGVISTAGNVTTLRQGTTLDINAAGASNTVTIGGLNGAGTITNSGAGSATAGTLSIGSTTSTAAGTFSGILQNGTGVLHVAKKGTGAQSLLGLSTYTGSTTIGSTGLVTVNTLANIGVASGIGAGDSTNDATNAASLVFNGSTGGLVYAGALLNGALTLGSTSASTNRLFTLAGTGATLSSTATNNNAIVWSNTGAIVHGIVGPQLLTLTGTSTGDNWFNPQLTDSGTGANVTSVTKTAAGVWVLGNSNNTYTGATTVANGTLRLGSSGSLPANSPLVLGSTTTTGTLEAEGEFTRSLAASAVAGSGTVTWGGTTGSGGFAASTGKLVVAIGGTASPAGLQWGTGGFVGTGGTQSLVLSSTTALSEVEFRNGIDLNGAVRTITVNDNTTTFTDFATLTGVLSNSAGTAGGISKAGTGALQLLGLNTYDGTTAVTAGTLIVTSLGDTTLGAGGTSVGQQLGANTQAQAVVLGNGTTGAGILQYVGPGETSDRMIRFNTTTGSNQIHADGSGPLILTNIVNDLGIGNKALILRGSNTAGNMVTSLLSDFSGGTLGVTVDGGAAWILTNPSNNYTGATTFSAGALGVGADTALGTGTLTPGSGSLFAYGGDRTIANPVTQSNNTTAAYIGDYSINLTSTYVLAAAANNAGITNGIVSGKTLNLASITANAITAARTLTINGSGDTLINGTITTSTAFNLNITYSGTGSLTLGGNGSDWNAGLLTVSSGTLKLGNDEAIPNGISTTDTGNMVISPAVGVTARFDLNGRTETINGLTANSAGDIIIDNTAATAASLTFGDNDQAVLFGGGLGNYTITDSGAGPLSITKKGTTAMTIATGATLTYQGTTNVTGGSLTIASPVSGTSGLSITSSGGTLALTGGLTTPSAITSVTAAGGTTLSLLDGQGSQMSNLTALTLGSSGGTMTTLNLNVGDLTTAGDGLQTDRMTLKTGGVLSLFAGNQITFNLTDAGLNANTTYTLLDIVDGGLIGVLAGTDYILGGTPGGFTSITFNRTNTSISITTGNLITGSSYWTAGGAADNWNDLANWAVDNKNGATPAVSIPGQGTDVHFIADSLAGGAAVTTTLEQNFKINSLTFEASTNPANTPLSVTIDPGVVSTNRLEIAPQLSADGLAITTGGPATVNINTPVKLGASQTWNVADAGSTLTLGALFGEADVVKTGAGRVILSAAADSTFNTGVTTDFTIRAGTLELNNAGALGTVANGNLVPVTLGHTSGANNATLQTSVTGLTFANPITLASGGTGTLTLGVIGTAISTTFSGGVTGTNDLTINSNATTGTMAFTLLPINISGTLNHTGAGSGATTISGGIGSNVTQITQNSATAALTISKVGTSTLAVNSGGTTITNVAGRILTVSSGVTGTGNLILKNDSTLAAGITISTNNVSNIGTITNSGTGTGGNTISAIIDTNVTGVIQDSATSALTLSGANTFTSGITIKKGTLTASTSGGALGAAGNVVTLGNTSGSDNATLQFQSSVTYNDTPINVVAGGSGVLTIAGSTTTGASIVPAPITLNHDLVIGAGATGATTAALTLSGGVTGTGNLTITYAATALTGGVTFSTNPVNPVGAITNNGNSTGATVFSSVIGANVTGITQNSATSALTLSGANTFTSNVTLTQGTLNINNASALGIGGTLLITTGTINNSSGAAVINSNVNPIIIDGNFTYTGTQALNLGLGNVSLGTAAGPGRTITANANTLTLGGVISNGATANSLTKAGAGTLLLSGANTFSGGLTISAGTLAFTTVTDTGGAANSLGQGPFSMAGATLSFVGDTTQSTNRPFTLTGDAVSVFAANGTSGATVTYTGAINAAGNTVNLDGSGIGFMMGGITQTGTTADVNKNGTGTWTLGGVNTIVDNMVIRGGVLILASASAFNGDDLFVTGATVKLGINGAVTSSMDDFNISTETASGGILDVNGTTGSAPSEILMGTATLSGSIIDSVGTGSIGGVFTFRQGVVSANLTGTGALSKSTAATVTLSGANTGYTGAATLTLGSLVLDYTANNSEKLSNSGAGALTGNGGTLILNGNDTASTNETLGGFTVNAGGTHITVNNGVGQAANLTLNGVTRTAVGGTVDFVMSSPSATIQTTTGNIYANILGGYATVSGSKFATVTGGVISGFDSSVNNTLASWATDDDLTDSSGYSGSVGDLRINSLRFNAPGTASTAAINANSLLQIRSGGILVTSNVGSGVASITGGSVMSGNGVDLIVHQNNATTNFTISSAIIGPAVTKSGTGTLTLSGNNRYNGQTTINEGTLKLSGGAAIGDTSTVSVKNGPGATLDVNGTTETIGPLTGGGADGGTVAINGGRLTINSTAASTYSGMISGAGALIKTGAGTLTLNTTANTFSGDFIINQGQVTLSDRTVNNFASVNSVILNNSTLLLDFTGGTETTTKINNAATVTLLNTGGVDGLRANNDRNDASKNEVVAAMSLLAGANTITLQENAAVGSTARQVTITAASIARSNQATLLVRGNNLGDQALSGVVNSGRLVATAAPSGADFVGGGGAAGSTTLSIVPWAIGSSTATAGTTHGTGNSFVTYAATTGFRPLTSAEYESLAASGGVTAANNVRYTNSADLTLDGVTARTMNALLIENTSASDGITLAGGGAPLNVASGSFLFVGAQGITVNGFSGITTTSALNEYILHVPNTSTAGVTIASPFTTSGAAFTKSGAGTLVLTATGSTYTGATAINQGALQIDALDKLGNNGSGGLLLNGGTLRFGGIFDPSAINVTFGIAASANVVTTAGGAFDTNGFDITLASSIGNSGNGGFAKTGLGTLTINGGSYTGTTAVLGGTLRLGMNQGVGAGDLSVNNAILDLNGFNATVGKVTLADAAGSVISGAGTLTSNGTVFELLQGSVSAVLGGTSNLVKNGANVVTLSGSNTYTGWTEINAGILEASSLSNFGAGSQIYFGGGTLRWATGTSFDISSRTVTLLSGTSSLDTNGNDITLAGVLTGGGNLAKIGLGALTLSGASNNGGLTTITAGTLVTAGSNSTLGATTLNGGTLSLDSNSNGGLANGLVTLTAGTLQALNSARAINNPVNLTAVTVSGTQDVTLNGSFTNNAGSRTLTSSITGGTLTLAGPVYLSEATGTGRTLTFAGTGSTVVSGVIANFNGGAGTAGAVIVANTGGITTFSGANTYTGSTSINNGTLKFGANQTMTGALQFGSAATTTTAGTFDLSNASATFGSLLAQTNSLTNTSNILIGSGQSLIINGAFTLGSGTATSTTLINASGAGALNVTNSAAAATFGVGGTSSGSTTADFSGLATMNVSLNTTDGLFRVSSTTGTNVANVFSVVTLAANTNITAKTLTVGGGGAFNGNAGQVNAVKLGSTANVLRVDAINIGTGARDLGAILFNSGTGTLNVRDVLGTGGVVFSMGTGTATTGVGVGGNSNTFDVTGHAADLLFTTVTIGTQNRNSDLANLFAFNQGTLAMNSLTMSTKGTNGFTTTSTMNLGGGTVSIGTGTGTAVTLATNTGPGSALATVNITGGAVTVTGNVVRGNNTGAGTATGTINLNGGSLNMSGNTVGSATNLITLAAQAGTLTGLGQLNGGGLLTKSTTGLLFMGNGNAYTGGTLISGGTLVAANTAGSATGTGLVTVGAAGTLAGGGVISGSVSLSGILAPGGIDSGSGESEAGDSLVGQLTVGGLTATVGATLQIQLGGATVLDAANVQLYQNDPGSFVVPASWTDYQAGTTAHDQLLISGAGGPNLDGLTIQFMPDYLNGFTPTYGHVFQVIDWASLGTNDITGSISYSLPTLDPAYSWDTSFLKTHGVIAVIPEPSRMLLLFVGLLALAFRRRRTA